MLDEPVEQEPVAEKEDKVEAFPEDKAPTIVEEPKPITYFGRNEREILFLISDPSSELLNQTDLDLFMKIVEEGLNVRHLFGLLNKIQGIKKGKSCPKDPTL